MVHTGDIKGKIQEAKQTLFLADRYMENLGFDAPDLKDVGRNAYRFINAVSDFATHAEPIRRTKNYQENLFMRTYEGNPMIDKAYQLVAA